MLLRTAMIREAMELTQSSIIDACVLSGCDMAPYVRNIGPSKAFAEIEKHSTLLMALRAMESGNRLRHGRPWGSQNS